MSRVADKNTPTFSIISRLSCIMETIWKMIFALTLILMIILVLGDRPTKMPTPQDAITGKSIIPMVRVNTKNADLIFNG